MLEVIRDDGVVQRVSLTLISASAPFDDTVAQKVNLRLDLVDEEGLVAEVNYYQLPCGAEAEEDPLAFRDKDPSGFDPRFRSAYRKGCTVTLLTPEEVSRAEQIFENGTLVAEALSIPGNRHLTWLYLFNILRARYAPSPKLSFIQAYGAVFGALFMKIRSEGPFCDDGEIVERIAETMGFTVLEVEEFSARYRQLEEEDDDDGEDEGAWEEDWDSADADAEGPLSSPDPPSGWDSEAEDDGVSGEPFSFV